MSLSLNHPVLLIEDTPSLQMVYRAVLQGAGFSVLSASTATEGMRAFQASGAKVVLLDLMLPDRDGLELVREICTQNPEAQVLVITANASINKAVESMQAGACDFLIKPFDETRFINAVRKAYGLSLLPPLPRGGGNARLPSGSQHAPRVSPADGTSTIRIRTEPPAPPKVQMIGQSPAMQKLSQQIAAVAKSKATVFITGESGTGKELCALAIHDQSPRASGPFIALNCGAIPQDLLESEVFGHLKGSFTGAISDRPGAAVTADGGTLFLDEICEMAPALQTKMLRFLETSSVQPVGAIRPRKVDIRIVCASNRDPIAAVKAGQFRQDLYYRLFVVGVHLPPLRERGSDVIAIAQDALLRFATEEGRAFRSLSPDICNLFRHLPWPGNIRQLLNVIRNVVVFHDGPEVTPDMLPDELLRDFGKIDSPPPPDRLSPLRMHDLLGQPLAKIERLVIEETLTREEGSVPRAARVLDVSPSTLYRKLESWGPLRPMDQAAE